VVQLPLLKKTIEKRKRKKGSSRLREETSDQERAMAKPVKKSKKFKVQSSGLSITEKIAGVKTGERKASSTSNGGDGPGHASVHAIDLYISFELTKKLSLSRPTESAREALLRRGLARNPLAPLLSKVQSCEVFIFCL
jgi:hypothetical protein